MLPNLTFIWIHPSHPSMEPNNIENLKIDSEDIGLEIINFDPPSETNVDFSLCLVGCFLSDRNIQSQIMKKQMLLVWKPFQGIAIFEDEVGRFLFQFYHQVDYQGVLNGDPWSFDKNILILGAIKKRIKPNNCSTLLRLILDSNPQFASGIYVTNCRRKPRQSHWPIPGIWCEEQCKLPQILHVHQSSNRCPKATNEIQENQENSKKLPWNTSDSVLSAIFVESLDTLKIIVVICCSSPKMKVNVIGSLYYVQNLVQMRISEVLDTFVKLEILPLDSFRSTRNKEAVTLNAETMHLIQMMRLTKIITNLW